MGSEMCIRDRFWRTEPWQRRSALWCPPSTPCRCLTTMTLAPAGCRLPSPRLPRCRQLPGGILANNLLDGVRSLSAPTMLVGAKRLIDAWLPVLAECGSLSSHVLRPPLLPRETAEPGVNNSRQFSNHFITIFFFLDGGTVGVLPTFTSSISGRQWSGRLCLSGVRISEEDASFQVLACSKWLFYKDLWEEEHSFVFFWTQCSASLSSC